MQMISLLGAWNIKPFFLEKNKKNIIALSSVDYDWNVLNINLINQEGCYLTEAKSGIQNFYSSIPFPSLGDGFKWLKY